MNSTITETAYFFHKRQSFLDQKSGVVKVKDLCRTRWAYRHEAYENFNILGSIGKNDSNDFSHSF